MIDIRVPIFSSAWSGTGTVIVPPSVRYCITTWLPRRRTSTKPFCWRMRQTSWPERTRSLAMGRFEAGYEDLAVQALLHLRRIGTLEEQLHGFLEIR